MSEPPSIPVYLEVTSVPGLLVAALRPLQEQARRSRIELHLAALGDVPETAVDREKIAWAVTALVGNAIRYESKDDAGGSVIVHVTYDDKTSTLGIAVQDDGPGIPDEAVMAGELGPADLGVDADRQVEALERKGWIERRAGEDDSEAHPS